MENKNWLHRNLQFAKCEIVLNNQYYELRYNTKYQIEAEYNTYTKNDKENFEPTFGYLSDQ